VTAPTKNIDYLFKPRSIAFVGATQAKVKWGFICFNNLMVGGYEGKVYPVNPGHEELLGLPCYPSVRDIPHEVDLAVFTVPAAAVLPAIDDCVAKGVKAGLVISAGFGELGEEGAEVERELVRRAEAGGMVLCGPNGQGLCCPESKLYPWMPIFFPKAGSVAVVCQSGNILNMLIGEALDAGLGISKGVSSGNEAQLMTEDYISYLADDPATDVIVAYIEGIEDGRRFLELTREATRRKPVVVLKGGRSSAGMKAASSHTGALAVSADLFASVCRQAGVVMASTIEEAGIVASSFVNRPLPRGRRVGIVTGGGGLGVIASDACVDAGLEIPALSAATLDSIRELLPEYWVPGNPVDLVAGLDLRVIQPIVELLMRSGEVDSVLFIFIESQRTKGVKTGDSGIQGLELGQLWDMMTERLGGYMVSLYGLAGELGVPLYVASNFDRVGEATAGTLGGGENPMVYLDVESACTAISAMADYAHLNFLGSGLKS
jgi:acyl-CoA synthetase (NDP forming)